MLLKIYADLDLWQSPQDFDVVTMFKNSLTILILYELGLQVRY